MIDYVHRLGLPYILVVDIYVEISKSVQWG